MPDKREVVLIQDSGCSIGVEGGATWTLYSDGLLEISRQPGQNGDIASNCRLRSEEKMQRAKYIVVLPGVICNKRVKAMFSGMASLQTADLRMLEAGEHTHAVDFSELFAGCGSLDSVALPRFAKDTVVNAERMFDGCKSLVEVDLSSWTHADITKASNMFRGCTYLESVRLDGRFDSEAEYDINELFAGCESLWHVSTTSAAVAEQALSPHRTPEAVRATSVTRNDGAYTISYNGDTGETTVRPKVQGSGMTHDAADTIRKAPELALARSFRVDSGPDDYVVLTDVNSLFAGLSNLESVDLSQAMLTDRQPLSMCPIDTSYMFWQCSGLRDLKLPTTGPVEYTFVTKAESMFEGCTSLREVDLADWRISQQCDWTYAFAWCESLERLALPKGEAPEQVFREAFVGVPTDADLSMGADAAAAFVKQRGVAPAGMSAERLRDLPLARTVSLLKDLSLDVLEDEGVLSDTLLKVEERDGFAAIGVGHAWIPVRPGDEVAMSYATLAVGLVREAVSLEREHQYLRYHPEELGTTHTAEADRVEDPVSVTPTDTHDEHPVTLRDTQTSTMERNAHGRR